METGGRFETCRSCLYGLADTGIAAAAADIALHGRIDVLIAGVGDLVKKGRRGEDLAALTVAALRDLFGEPSFLHRVGIVRREPFDGGDGLVDNGRCGDRAGTDGVAVEKDRAGATLGNSAAEFCTGEADDIPDDPKEGHFFVRLDSDRLPVDVEGVCWHNSVGG